MLQDMGYEADSHYVAGVLEIYGHDGRVLELDGCRVLSQHLGGRSVELEEHDLHVGSETLEDAIFRKYDSSGKGYLTKQEVATMMAVLGYEVDAEYIDGLLEISGSEGEVLDLEGFKIISQSLGTGADSATLEDAMFHKYKHDAGGKGYLAAGEVGSLLEDLGYGRVDSEYITGLLEIYGNEEGVLGPDGFKVFSQHLGGEVSEAETHELPALVELPSTPSASSLRRRR